MGKRLLIVVWVLLAGVVVTSLGSARVAEGSAPVFSEEDFDGTELDSGKWTVATNGYPAPAVSVAGGFVQMGQPGTSSQDFPYVVSVTNPFPLAEPFDVEFELQFIKQNGNGTAVAIIGSSNELLFSVWNDSGKGLRIFLSGGGSSIPIASPVTTHKYLLRFVQGSIVVFVDGSNLGTAPTTALPATVWIGHPTVGQVLFHPGVQAAQPDPVTGLVSERWWGTSQWTTLRLDYIRVTSDDTDSDGCTNTAELSSAPGLGGLRNPKYFWDFYDVWTHPPGDPQGWERNRAINILDILGVASRFGANDSGPGAFDRNSDPITTPNPAAGTRRERYHPSYDRGPIIGANHWNRAPADGFINLVDDILGVARQFGHNCA